MNKKSLPVCDTNLRETVITTSYTCKALTKKMFLLYFIVAFWVGMCTLCQNNLWHNWWQKESAGTIPE